MDVSASLGRLELKWQSFPAERFNQPRAAPAGESG